MRRPKHIVNAAIKFMVQFFELRASFCNFIIREKLGRAVEKSRSKRGSALNSSFALLHSLVLLLTASKLASFASARM